MLRRRGLAVRRRHTGPDVGSPFAADAAHPRREYGDRSERCVRYERHPCSCFSATSARCASEVDRIEVELNEHVCSGKLNLAEAQRAEVALKHEHG